MSASLADQFAAAVAAAKDLEPACLADLWAKYLDEIPTKGVVRSFFNYEAPRPVLLQFATQLEKLDPSVQVRVDSFGIQIFARRTVHDTATFFDDPSYDKFADLVFAGGITPALYAFLKWKFHYLQLSGDNLLWVRDPDSNSTQYNLCHGHVPMRNGEAGDLCIGSEPPHVLPCWHVEQSHALFSKLYPVYSFCKSWPADSRERVFDFGGRELTNDGARSVTALLPDAVRPSATPVVGTVTAVSAPAANPATPLPVPVQSPVVTGDLVYIPRDGRLRLCTVKWAAPSGGLVEVVQGQGILKPSTFWGERSAVVPAEPFAAAMPSQVQSNRLDPTETALFCTVIQAYTANSLIDIELHSSTRLAFYRGSRLERAFGKADHASSDVLKAVWFGPDDLIVTLHCEPCTAGLFDAIVTEAVAAPVPAAAETVAPAHKVGDLVSATDMQHECYIARVIAVNSIDRSIRVHYLGFDEYYDEWIPVVSSHRVGPPLPLNIAQVQLCVGTEQHLVLMLAILQCAPSIKRVLKGIVSVDRADGKGVVWYGDESLRGVLVAQVQCTNGSRVSMYHRYDTSGNFSPIIALKDPLPAAAPVVPATESVEPEPAAAKPVPPTHKVGDLVVATDTLNCRFIARVTTVRADSVRVHYLGCSCIYDEWIPVVSSHRLGPPLQSNTKQLKLAVGTDEQIRLMLAILECAPLLRTVYDGVVAVDAADGKGAVWFGGKEDTCGPQVAHIQCVVGDRVAKVAMYATGFDAFKQPFNPIIALSASVDTAV